VALAFLNPVSAGPVADSTISVAHDCGSGADRWLFVAVPLFSAGETPTVASVAYDGAALSPVVQGEHLYAGNTNVVRAEWWALDVAAAGKTGSNNVVVTLSGAADRLAVIAFTATGCGGPGLDTNTAGGNLSVVSAAIDTAADIGRVVGLWTGAAARGVTPGTGNTVVVARDDGTAPPNNIVAWAGWEPGTGGSVAWDITLSSAVRSAAAVIELLEVDIIDVVTASADADGMFDAGGGFSTAFWTLGNASGVGRSAFAHYPAITIPSGATIAFATLVLRHKFTDTKDIDVLVRAADAANPAAPTTGTEALALDRTTAATPVHFGSVVANASVYIDVTAVIRELVDSYDYSSGAAMLILCDDDNSPTIGDFNHLHFLAYDDGATLGPRLIIGYEVEGGGDEIIEEVALVAETDTALPLIGQKQRAVAQVAETDTAQAVTAAKVVAVAQVAESDAALAFSRLKVRAVGMAAEADEALPITEATGAIIVAVGLVTEMDTALPVAWSPKARLVGLATESDVAQAVTRQKARELGAAAETDAAQVLAAAKSLVLATATESDLAQGIVRVKRATLAQALERDAALAIAIGGLAVVIDGPTLAALASTGRTFVELAGSGRTLTVLAGTGKTTVDVD